jgi:hypothetical protein
MSLLLLIRHIMNNKNVAALLFSTLFLLSFNLLSQTRKTWTAPVMITEMNGGKIYVSYCSNSKDSIHYRIKSHCSGLKNIYTCFAFKYLDKNLMERVQIIRDIPLEGNFDKEYSISAAHGIIKITTPYLPETVVAYVIDPSEQINIR